MADLKRSTVASVTAVSLLLAGPAAAQLSNPYGTPYDPFATEPGNAQRSTAAPSQSQSRSAADQVSASSGASADDNTYRPDRLDDRSGSRNAGDENDLDEDNASGRSSNDRRRTTDRRDSDLNDRTRPARPYRPSEFENYVSQIADSPVRRFGSELLTPSARDFVPPPTTAVPADYRINPGDELVIGLTGSVQAQDMRLVVSSEGRVFIPRVGAVTVAGARYGDVQSLLARQIGRQYRDFRLTVTMGRLRGITVYVTGFATTPGSYTLNSLSTLVNAVLAAGGPSAGGSFRSIQLRRGGKLISDFDLYDLLLKGDKRGDALLQNGDVIYVAPVGAQVAVIGSVNKEAVYELGARDTIADALLYAGGASTVADDTRLLLLDPVRPDKDGWEQITPAEARTRVASRAQVVRVLSAVGITRPVARQPVLVTLSGEVAKPGRYYVAPGTSLTAVVTMAGGLTAQAYPYASVITRETVRQQQRVSFDRALADLQQMLTTQPLVAYNSSEQLQPARIAAVQSLVQLLQARKPEGRIVFDIAPGTATLPGDLILENNDTIFVPTRPITVGVFGEVPSPASFQFDGSQTIGQYVRKAGGVLKQGDRGQIFVVRANGSVLGRGSGLLGKKALPGDLIYVPVDANRGAFWARLRDITGIVFQGALAAAAINAVSN